jgi:two-component system capsular synthesis response regulator RcsB
MKFEKILVVEDQEMVNVSLRRTLEDYQLPTPQYAYYCDHALTLLKIALKETQPYDLLVTDLYFEDEGTAKQLPDGKELVKAAKALQADLKILVFSGESRSTIIRSLYEEYNIDGYVRKGRGDAQELKSALENLAKSQRYYSREFRSLAVQENQHDFTAYDKTIVRLLAKGYAQKDIPAWLDDNDIRPSGLSSIEKRLNLIKSAMGFTKNEQLVIFCKDIGLI